MAEYRPIGNIESGADVTAAELSVKYGVRVVIVEALMEYGVHGHAPGDFLRAVLCNDLMSACGRADMFNAPALPAIAQLIYNELPSPCHGSPAAVDAWIKLGEQRRAEAKEASRG